MTELNAAVHMISGFFIACLFCATSAPAGQDDSPPHYLGSAACATCHPAQAALWQKSHHAQSMQVADARTVLGDFNQVVLTQHGQTIRFSRHGKQFIVRTAGPDGKQHDYTVAFTFGIYPLQQYLLTLPSGRLQALGVAWDARPRAQGGQRWFHLYPDDPPHPGESIHWSGRDQNWNFMCASCHSTGLRKNYELSTDGFSTTWAEINVACEACHGAGGAHSVWAAGDRTQRLPHLGLGAPLHPVRDIAFSFAAPSQKIATLNGDAGQARAANEMCVSCHSRRQELVKDKAPSAKFLDNYLPSLIEPHLYHADGQVDGEVFEAGSFAQSRMHRAGVTCSHCHEPHSLQLRAAGNALCGQCHRADAYDNEAHHHHAPGSAGAQCVACHMPVKTFMGVHERHDHSLRVPRPDISVQHGTPNACTDSCHRERSATWAADAVRQWRGSIAPTDDPHFTAAVRAAMQGKCDAEAWTATGVASRWLRASLLTLCSRAPLSPPLSVLSQAARDDDGLVRVGAARSLGNVDAYMAGAAETIAAVLLADPLRAVRIETARAVLSNPALHRESFSALRWQAAVKELLDAEMAAAERPEAHVNVAIIQRQLGDEAAAEQALRTALRLVPDFVPALVNLADLYRAKQRDVAAESLLRNAVHLAPQAGEPAYALGLLLVRTGRREEALVWLQKAARLAPDNPRFALGLRIAREEVLRMKNSLQ